MVRRLVLFLSALGLLAGHTLILAASASASQSAGFIRVSEAFSPNGDGRRDEAVVRFELTEAGDVSLVVQSHDDTNALVTHRSVQLGPHAAGEHTWKWDGRDDHGTRLTEGYYTVEMTVTDPDGTRAVTRDYTQLDTSVDLLLQPRDTEGLLSDEPQTIYPRTEVVRDSVALASSPGPDEQVRQATLFIKNRTGRTVLSRDVTGSPVAPAADVVWTARRDGKPLPPGRYRAFVRATDLAGNEGRSSSVRLRVSGKLLDWRRVTRVVTPARSATGESYACWTGSPGCGEGTEPCGTVAPSEFYHGGLSYRSGECAVPAAVNGAAGLHWLPVPQTSGVRGVAAARVAFTGRPTVEGETDAGTLLVYGEGWLSSKEATSSTGAQTGWVRGLQMGQGNADMGILPGVLWSFRTTGTDAVDVDRFTVTMRYFAVAD